MKSQFLREKNPQKSTGVMVELIQSYTRCSDILFSGLKGKFLKQYREQIRHLYLFCAHQKSPQSRPTWSSKPTGTAVPVLTRPCSLQCYLPTILPPCQSPQQCICRSACILPMHHSLANIALQDPCESIYICSLHDSLASLAQQVPCESIYVCSLHHSLASLAQQVACESIYVCSLNQGLASLAQQVPCESIYVLLSTTQSGQPSVPGSLRIHIYFCSAVLRSQRRYN